MLAAQLPDSLTLPWLLARGGVLARWLVDFLRVSFRWRALVGASSLCAFILSHLRRLRSRIIFVSLQVPLWGGLFSSDDDVGFPEGCWNEAAR